MIQFDKWVKYTSLQAYLRSIVMIIILLNTVNRIRYLAGNISKSGYKAAPVFETLGYSSISQCVLSDSHIALLLQVGFPWAMVKILMNTNSLHEFLHNFKTVENLFQNQGCACWFPVFFSPPSLIFARSSTV